jgi:hypothetical protein
MQLRFTSFVVINLRRDLHPQECAHAGRTKAKRPHKWAFATSLDGMNIGCAGKILTYDQEVLATSLNMR